MDTGSKISVVDSLSICKFYYGDLYTLGAILVQSDSIVEAECACTMVLRKLSYMKYIF